MKITDKQKRWVDKVIEEKKEFGAVKYFYELLIAKKLTLEQYNSLLQYMDSKKRKGSKILTIDEIEKTFKK